MFDNKNPEDEPGEQRLPEPVDSEQVKQAMEALNVLASRIADGDIDADGLVVDATLNELKLKTGLKKGSLEHELKKLFSAHIVDKNAWEPETYTDSEIAAGTELLKQPDLFAQFAEDFKLTGYLANSKLTTAGLLFLGRTFLPTSSAQYNYGKTSSGKTEFAHETVAFYPRDRVINLTDITPRYLYRRGGEDGKALQHCILVFGEMAPPNPQNPGVDSIKQAAIRQLITENVLTLGTVDDVKGERNVAIDRKLYGPVTMTFTGTTSPSNWNDETMNRTFGWHFQHTHESIKKVLEGKATKGAISTNPFASDNGALVKAQRKWRAAFSLLKRFDPTDPAQFYGVEIPFLEELIFRKTKLTEPEMRSFDMLKHCIAVSALLHQMTREVKEEKGSTVLVATLEDYTRIKDTYLEMVPRTTQGLSNDLITTFIEKLLPAWTDSKAKSQAAIATMLGVPLTTAKRAIYAWCDADLIEVDEDLTSGNKRTAKKYYRLSVDFEKRAEAIKERGDLKIDAGVYVSDETSRTSESDSEISGTGGDSSLSETKMDEAGRPVDECNQLMLDHDLTSLVQGSNGQPESQASTAIQDANNSLSTRLQEHTHTQQDNPSNVVDIATLFDGKALDEWPDNMVDFK